MRLAPCKVLQTWPRRTERFLESGDRAAAIRYIHPVLRGTDPGELPVEEVTEYELVVNRGLAARHGWSLSPAVLVQTERLVG